VAALLYTGFIRAAFYLIFLHTGSSVVAELGAGAFEGADADIQNQATCKLSSSFAVTSYLALKYQADREAGRVCWVVDICSWI